MTDCQYANDREPCWGAVELVDEVPSDEGEDCYEWVFACRGHAGVFDGDPYREWSVVPAIACMMSDIATSVMSSHDFLVVNDGAEVTCYVDGVKVAQ